MDYSDKVLLLNATYEPLTVIHWKHAVRLHCKNKVRILEEKDEELHSADDTHPNPSVVVLIEKVTTPRLPVKFSRDNIYQRDNYTCQYCGEKYDYHKLTFDHVVPQSKGGKTTWKNIVTSCFDCNTKKKGDRTPQEAGLTLNKKPKQPRWTPIEKMGIEDPPEKWEPYLWR